MAIVTLTSDFGNKDHYAAMLKGAILNLSPNTSIIDISHQIPCFDLVRASIVIKQSWKEFPVGTIHLVSVNLFVGNISSFIVFEKSGHYFVGPDNGIFSLVFDQLPSDIYILEHKKQSTFPQKNIFAQAVGHINSKKPLHEIGFPAKSVERRILLQPVVGASQIRGSVIYLDHYGNIITNIKKDLFEKVAEKREFAIYFKRHEPLHTICQVYTDVPLGESLALFNEAGYLEIAMHAKNATQLLDMQLDDTIQIDFFLNL